ncbi:MAG: hydroxymethylglutaryl-CoA lyase [Deltaproteobacteria bacterium]|jgi:hydroxymethylglutaryl-CoA lyase|nr:hydroxymethylglutaryl-CoA lyase [Deltaproteobacteria bacterium]
MNLPNKAVICEVGPRDGLQNEKKLILTEQKVNLVKGCIDAGIKIIEIGSFVNPRATPQMADTAEVLRGVGKVSGVEFRALVPNVRGAERAIEAGIGKIKLTASASESHNRNNFNKTPLESVRGFADCVKLAKDAGIPLSAAIGTAFGCPFEGVVSLGQVEYMARSFIDLGITEISMSDTTGMAHPLQVYTQCAAMRKAFPQVKWVLHFHNTRNMALANIFAGLMAGVTWFDGSFAGLGGCPFAPGASGNVATEDILNMFAGMGVETGVDIDKMIAVARLAREYVGHETESGVLKAGKTTDLAPFTKCAQS